MLLSRIAPTPSGYLHLGNVFNFLLVDSYVRSKQGALMLRIDDSDAERCRDDYLEDIFRCIDFLKINIDQGPSGVEDFKKNYSQKLRLAQYKEYVDLLKTKELLFSCRCSRKDIVSVSSAKSYPGTCRNLNLKFSEQRSWRVDSVKLNSFLDRNTCAELSNNKEVPRALEDFVVLKKDGNPSYQIISLWEDEKDKVTDVIRGQDLESSSLAQMQLAKSLGLKKFLKVKFLHHPLLKDSQGAKLSKSNQTSSFLELSGRKNLVKELRLRVDEFLK